MTEKSNTFIKVAPDAILRHTYSEKLRKAAEDFMVNLFTEKSDKFSETMPDREIHAAMKIICGISYVQPSDEQVKMMEKLEHDKQINKQD